jgi:hypothetical protein
LNAAARIAAATGALAGLAGLGLQYWLLSLDMTPDGASAFDVLWRFYAYFTLLTNTFVTLVMGRAALQPEAQAGLNSPRVELMAVTSIMFVCIVYNLLLASRWDPQGWQKVADVIVHNAVPLLCLVFWGLRPHGGLKWRDAAFAALWPLSYAIYGLTRGQFDGFYPYFFLDPTSISWVQIALNLIGLVTAFIVGALLLIGVGRALGGARGRGRAQA